MFPAMKDKPSACQNNSTCVILKASIKDLSPFLCQYWAVFSGWEIKLHFLGLYIKMPLQWAGFLGLCISKFVSIFSTFLTNSSRMKTT